MRDKFKKKGQYWNFRMATLLRLGHAVAEGQTVTCCECGSVVIRLCLVVATLEVCTKDEQH
jgi:hypothetical protein